MEIGYWLSSEEHGPKELVENAKRAEDAGFGHVLISDHIHPWVDAQGHSPFVWGVIGAIAESTERIQLGTAVTCPLIRMHPAIVAHAAATAQALLDGRFFLGLGTGENLNEHVLGDRWPRADERLEMLDEAVDVIRALLGGDYETYPRQALHGRAGQALRRVRRMRRRSSSRPRRRMQRSSRRRRPTGR